jgi:hypothetical protein
VLFKWFPDRRGLITGIAVGGFGAGPLEATRLWAERPINGLPRVGDSPIDTQARSRQQTADRQAFRVLPFTFQLRERGDAQFRRGIGNKGDVLFRLLTRNRTLRNRIRNTVFGSP